VLGRLYPRRWIHIRVTECVDSGDSDKSATTRCDFPGVTGGDDTDVPVTRIYITEFSFTTHASLDMYKYIFLVITPLSDRGGKRNPCTVYIIQESGLSVRVLGPRNESNR
jgi:hypothetical protein